LSELPAGDIVLFDLSPARAADIMGSRLDARVARAYRRYRHGPAAFKVDFAVEGEVPWTNEACRRAGTVHAVGSFAETVQVEADINRGRMPDRPFVLVGQQHLADPSRSAGDVHPLWAYAHVPNGWNGDGTEVVINQIERFAPGFRARIVAKESWSPAEFESYNSNFVGGDIIGGANTPLQIAVRPRVGLHPYATGIPGVFMCSASTPPGAGVHGMNGFNAARAALGELD
ncbi:MAG: FAD-dependent oxidoreductase, partial [Solirubrobacterales bacterium]